MKEPTPTVKIAALRCPHCNHVWVPKGKFGPRRCPKCWTVTVPR